MGRGFPVKEATIGCVPCKHGEISLGPVTVSRQREQTTVIIKDVPADMRANCGEYYLDEDVTAQVLSMAEDAAKKNAEVAIFRFAA